MNSRQFLLVVFVVASLIFIFSCQIVANVAQWQRGPSIHAWMEEKRNALLFPQFVDNASAILLWPEDQVTTDRMILQAHALSSFSPQGLSDAFADRPDGIIRSSGWYADNWISHHGYAVFNANSESNISFEGSVPEFIPNNHIVVQLNDKVIFAGNLTRSVSTSFTGQEQKGLNVINVTCEKEVIPASLGINGDLRPLAFHLSINRM
jgi:hypothetical protein